MGLRIGKRPLNPTFFWRIEHMKMNSGVALAATAAALFVAGVSAPVAYAADSGVKCSGVNSCKGSSECKTATNECKGQNSCKGHGWVTKSSAEDCKAAGGRVLK